ncbi:hypothetical protein [Tolypothrix sp. VBCCA 56010]|uniref:hypothetical protein n=1 Tax=Tolypothrix sp. VBCCA 56010 TaxID=3137731 RepID=UPI003D7E025B
MGNNIILAKIGTFVCSIWQNVANLPTKRGRGRGDRGTGGQGGQGGHWGRGTGGQGDKKNNSFSPHSPHPPLPPSPPLPHLPLRATRMNATLSANVSQLLGI